MARKSRAVQTFIPVLPRGMTHNDLEPYVFTRGGKQVAGIRKGGRLKSAEAEIAPYLERAAPESPLSGGIRERVKYCFLTRDGKHKRGEPMCEPPDLDNMTKVLNDLCERFGYVADDCQIFDCATVKAWVRDVEGIFVRFEEVV